MGQQVVIARVYREAGVLDPAACRRLCDEMAVAPLEAAVVLPDTEMVAGGRQASYADVSDATLDAVEQRLDAVRGALEAFFECGLGPREGAGFLRYPAGGFYGPHLDRARDASWPGAALRRVSAVLFLNSAGPEAGAFTGGSLLIYPNGTEPVEIVPAAGLLVAFPSDTLHEVMPVEGGVRCAVVDWFYDPPSVPSL
jgi:predicted 2-oxoglutarate/Fe(II)-dependent dioxygenase YbiX